MEYWLKFTEWIESTQVPAQIREVDAVNLFTNPYFLIPFIILIGYMLYKQAFKNIILLGIGTAVWIFTGSEYMQNLTVDGELQLDKVLPVVFGGAIVMGIIIYMYFGRSD